MLSVFSKFIFILLLGFLINGVAVAQNMDMPDPIKENLAKMRIKQEKKDYDELVKRGEEAAKLGEELSESYEENKKLSETDQKKLEKLEKIVKKIRNELGAEEDDEADKEEKPSTVLNTLTTIKEKTSNLLSELKKASRYSISVVAVESSNTVVRLIKFLRFNKN